MYFKLFFFLHFWIVIFILRNLRFGRKKLCIDSWSYIYPAKIIYRRHWLYWGWRRCSRIHCFWRLRKPFIIRIEEFRRHFSHAAITAVNVNLVFCCRSFFFCFPVTKSKSTQLQQPLRLSYKLDDFFYWQNLITSQKYNCRI